MPLPLLHLALTALCTTVLAMPAGAQGTRASTAPSAEAVASAQIATDRAESALFAGVRRRTRDPEARAALAEYLAGRGAWRVASVLYEEALRFGGAREAMAPPLARLYARLGMWPAVLAMTPIPLPPAEVERARWLSTRSTGSEGPDSTRLPFRPGPGVAGVASSGTIGRVRIHLGEREVDAEVDPRPIGLVLDPSLGALAGVRRFGAERETAAVDRLGVGAITLRGVAARLAPLGGAPVRLGIDVLWRLAPAREGDVLVLRRSGRTSEVGLRLPLHLRAEGLATSADEREGSVAIRELLRVSPRWAIDPRRGELVLPR